MRNERERERRKPMSMDTRSARAGEVRPGGGEHGRRCPAVRHQSLPWSAYHHIAFLHGLTCVTTHEKTRMLLCTSARQSGQRREVRSTCSVHEPHMMLCRHGSSTVARALRMHTAHWRASRSWRSSCSG